MGIDSSGFDSGEDLYGPTWSNQIASMPILNTCFTRKRQTLKYLYREGLVGRDLSIRKR